MSKALDGEFGSFPTTHWSLVRRAGQSTGSHRRDALAELLKQYLPAMRYHLVAGKRLDAHQADDLLQSFLSDKVLEEDFIRKAEEGKGKFRNFLLVALNRFYISRIRHDRAQKRAPRQMSALDDLPEPSSDSPRPDEIFDVAWARQVLDSAIQRMRGECEKSGRPELWALFDQRVLAPALGFCQPTAYEKLVAEYGFASPVQASNAVITAKRMFIRILRLVVGEYARSDEQIDEEIRDLQTILSRAH